MKSVARVPIGLLFFLTVSITANAEIGYCPTPIEKIRQITVNQAEALWTEVSNYFGAHNLSIMDRKEWLEILNSLEEYPKNQDEVHYRTESFGQHACHPYVKCRMWVQFDCESQLPTLMFEADPD